MSDDQRSILARTAHGAGWVIAWRLATRFLGLVSTLILVRLMAPDEFGLMALAAAFVITVEVCLELGVEDQIVRAEAPTRDLYDTAFTLELLRGLAVGMLVLLAAEPAANFFNEPRLYWVLIALSFSSALSGMANVGVVDFRRDLQFDREFLLQLAPRLAAMLTTVGLAFVLQSHWALVAGMLVNRVGVIMMSYAMHSYRPMLSLSAWRDFASVSAWSWGLGVATLLRDRSDSFVIGRSLGSAPVGHYNAGVEIAVLPVVEMVDSICRACMPGFAASKRAGGAESASDYLRILALLALLTFPAGLGISLVAGPVVALAYGQAWLEAVPVIVVMGAGSLLAVFGNVSKAMLHAHARLASLTANTLFSALLRLGLLLLFTPAYGLFGAALAVTLSLIIEQMLMVGWTLRMLRVWPTELLARLWRPAISAAVMCAVLWSTGLGWAPAPAAAGQAAKLLAAGIGVGVLSHTTVVMFLWMVTGRAQGPETDFLGLLRRIFSSLIIGARRAIPPAFRRG